MLPELKTGRCPSSRYDGDDAVFVVVKQRPDLAGYSAKPSSLRFSAALLATGASWGQVSSARLIALLSMPVCPLAKDLIRFLTYKPDCRNFSSFWQQANFFIYEFIVETYAGRICSRIGVVDATNLRPIDRTQTHRTRFAVREDNAVRQVGAVKYRAGLPNSYYLGMSAGIISRSHLIPPLRDNRAITHNHCPEWTFAVFARKRDCPLHKRSFIHCRPPASIAE